MSNIYPNCRAASTHILCFALFLPSTRFLKRWSKAIPWRKEFILDPNSAPKRVRELMHLCMRITARTTQTAQRHFEKRFPPQNGLLFFYNLNHFTMLWKCNARFGVNIVDILVLTFYYQLKLKIIYHYCITKIYTQKESYTINFTSTYVLQIYTLWIA